MENGRERVTAAVILIVFLMAAIFLYLILLPQPVTYSLIYGNFNNNSISNNTSHNPIPNSFYYPISSYVGGNQLPSNYSYQMGTFDVSYNVYNSTTYTNSPFSLSSSIFGPSSYNIGFNGSMSDAYFIGIRVGSVSGSPNLKLSLNGNNFYTGAASSGENLTLSVPGVINGKNTITISNYLNGFAFSQSIDFSNVSVTQMYKVSVSHSTSTSINTLDGLGNFYLQFTPIGQGPLSVYINGQQLTALTTGNDNPTTMIIPSEIVNNATAQSNSPATPVTFNTVFSVEGQGSSYEIANCNIVYSEPNIALQKVVIPYSVKQSSSGYVLVLYVSSILKEGDTNFELYPSGDIFQIASSALTVGQNALVLPSGALSGEPFNGNFTGTITVSSTGLIIPKYLDLKPSS
ncbi:MAG: hypothetical protein M1433_02075 [Candidatus Parvarchaeota archaeon]|nr:hypothetical protein [Candidatus Parvarchaeota archaeon]